jgi:hypothetical protein
VTGINMELLGMRDANQPGILEAQRKQAALTILATLFDSLRRFRKEVGRVRLHYIQNFLSDGRLIRIAGDDGYRLVPLLRDNTIGSYDVIVDDAPTSPNQKDQTWGMLLQLMPIFKNMMTPEAAMIVLEYSPLPSKVVEAFKALMSQPNPEAEMQKQLIMAKGQAEVAELQGRAMKAKSGAHLDVARADHERVGSVLDMAKAASEITQAKLDQAHTDFLNAEAEERLNAASVPDETFENPFLIEPSQSSMPQLPQLPSGPAFIQPPVRPLPAAPFVDLPSNYAGPSYGPEIVPELAPAPELTQPLP